MPSAHGIEIAIVDRSIAEIRRQVNLPPTPVDLAPALRQRGKPARHDLAHRDSTGHATEEPVNAQTRLGRGQNAAAEILPDAIESRRFRDPIRIASGDDAAP